MRLSDSGGEPRIHPSSFGSEARPFWFGVLIVGQSLWLGGQFGMRRPSGILSLMCGGSLPVVSVGIATYRMRRAGSQSDQSKAAIDVDLGAEWLRELL